MAEPKILYTPDPPLETVKTDIKVAVTIDGHLMETHRCLSSLKSLDGNASNSCLTLEAALAVRHVMTKYLIDHRGLDAVDAVRVTKRIIVGD